MSTNNRFSRQNVNGGRRNSSLFSKNSSGHFSNNKPLGRDTPGSNSSSSFSTELPVVHTNNSRSNGSEQNNVSNGNISNGNVHPRSSPSTPSQSPVQGTLDEAAVTAGEGNGSQEGSSRRSDQYSNLDENMQPGWEAFTTFAVRGKIDLNTLILFVNDMGIECDKRLAKKAAKQEGIDWSKGISFESAMKLADVIPTLLTDGLSVSDSSMQGNIRYLNPLEFLQRRFGGGGDQNNGDGKNNGKGDKSGKKDGHQDDNDDTDSVVTDGEDVEYRLKLCNISPRTRLLLTTAIIFFVVAAAIVILMTLLWMNASFHRVDQRMQTLATTLAYLSEATVDLSIASVGETVGSQTYFFTAYIENEWIQAQNATMTRVSQSIAEMAVIVSLMGTGVSKQRGESLDARMKLFVALMEATDYVPEIGVAIHNQLQRWALREGKEFAILDGATGTWIDGSTSEDKYEDSSCFAPIQAGQRIGSIVDAPVDLEGVSGSHVAYCVTTKRILCVTVGVRSNTRLIRTRIIELFNDCNQKANDKFIQAGLSDETRGTVAAPAEFLVWYPDDSETDGKIRQRNPSNATTEYCLMSFNQAVCSQFQTAVDNCYTTKCSLTSLFTQYIDGYLVYGAVVYVELAKSVITIAVRHETIKELHQVAVINAVNSVNSISALPMELILSVVSKAQEVIPDVTEAKKVCAFGDECLRVDAVQETFRLALNNPQTLYSAEYTNYVLTPVIGATLAVEGGLETALTLEISSEFVRSVMVERLAQKYNDINAIWPDTLEVMFYKRKDTPTSPIFDPTETCPENVLCTTSDTYGVLARDDCTNCLRFVNPPVGNRSAVIYLTDFKVESSRYIAGQQEQPHLNDDIVMSIVDTDDVNFYSVSVADNYAGKPARAVSTMFAFFRGYITVYELDSESLDLIYRVVAIIASASCGVVLLGILCLVWLSRRTLQKVENEWLSFKEGIDEEKSKFKSMIREIVPKRTFDRYSRGQKAVAESHQMLSFAFIDVSSFAEKQKGLSARELVRTLAYHATLYNTVAGKYHLFRLRSFGDTAAYIGGLNGDEPPSTTAFSTASFASTVVQLLSPMFSHFPQKLPQLAETFKGDEKKHRVTHPVLPVRVGLHCGPAVSSLIDFGRTPNYDIHGPSLSLARRMQATATVGRVNCSTAFKELLEAGDLSGQFEFDQVRKLVVKGQGTVSTFPFKSMAVPIGEALLKSLYVEHAVAMFDFRPLSSQVKGGTNTNTKSHSQSSVSHVTGSSNASSMLGDQVFTASTNAPSVVTTDSGYFP